MNNLKAGDVVCLKSSPSPEMTVESITGEGVKLVWFVHDISTGLYGELQKAVIPENALEKIR